MMYSRACVGGPLAEQRASRSLGLRWPHKPNFAGLKVDEPPPRTRGNSFGCQEGVPGCSFQPEPGSSADTHSHANPTLHPTQDDGQEEPSAQITVTPSHFDELFSYDAWHRTCDSLLRLVPEATASQGRTTWISSSGLSSARGDLTTQRPVSCLKDAADSKGTDDDSLDEPCPVRALATVHPGARTTTWCRLVPKMAGWFTQLRRLRVSRLTLRALVFRKEIKTLSPAAGLSRCHPLPSTRQLHRSGVHTTRLPRGARSLPPWNFPRVHPTSTDFWTRARALHSTSAGRGSARRHAPIYPPAAVSRRQQTSQRQSSRSPEPEFVRGERTPPPSSSLRALTLDLEDPPDTIRPLPTKNSPT